MAAPERAVLVAPRRDLAAGELLAAAYDFAGVPTGPGGEPAVVVVTGRDGPTVDAPDAILRHIVLHPGAKVVNSWRDALVALARDAGTSMTKNEARARIAAESLAPALARLRPWELPLTVLRALVDAVPRTVSE